MIYGQNVMTLSRKTLQFITVYRLPFRPLSLKIIAICRRSIPTLYIFRCLRNVQVLLDAAVLEMQQYSAVVARYILLPIQSSWNL